MHRTHIAKQTTLAIAALALCSAAAAQDGGGLDLRVSGFGTVGVVRTNTDAADFAVPGQPSGATRSASAKPDTKFGVQATSRIDRRWSLTGQALTRHNGEGNWQPEVEWLYGKVQVTPNVALRAGRMGAPFFAVSDFREVNYANTWTRPPIDVYGQVPLSHFDGADAAVRWTLGEATLNAQVLAGRSKGASERTHITLDDLRAVNLTAEFGGGWTLRVGHSAGRLTMQPAELLPLLEALSASSFADVAQQLDARHKQASFSGLGLGFDEGRWIAAAEYTRRRTESFVADTTGWFASFGVRFGRFTPYGVVSRLRADDSNVDNTVPKGVDDGLTALSTSVDEVLARQGGSQKTAAMGVRWDAARNLAVKLQHERIRIESGAGLTAQPRPGFGPGARLNATSLSVDFVF